MGGEWTSGAALVSEWWPSEHRGKALGFMQSGWAIGYALAGAAVRLVQPRFGWRAVFFVGILPAFLTLWIRATRPEPRIWMCAPTVDAHGLAPDQHLRQRRRVADDRAHADEHLHAVRLVGFQPVASQLSQGTGVPGRNRARPERGCRVRGRDAGWDVDRLCDLRVRERSIREEAKLCGLSDRRRCAAGGLRECAEYQSCYWCWDRWSPLRRPDTSAGSARSPQRFIPPPYARQRRALPTTLAGWRAQRHRTWWDHWQNSVGSARHCWSVLRRSCWPRLPGSGSRKRKDRVSRDAGIRRPAARTCAVLYCRAFRSISSSTPASQTSSSQERCHACWYVPCRHLACLRGRRASVRRRPHDRLEDLHDRPDGQHRHVHDVHDGRRRCECNRSAWTSLSISRPARSR